MFAYRWARCGLLIFAFFFTLSILEIDAWARVGGGRSFGSFGIRTFSMTRSAPTPMAPSQGSRQYGTPATPASSRFGGGGFLRSMAGGIAGGMLGGMLFRSLGFAGDANGFGGGIGFMDIILIGALLYGIYWIIRRRRSEATAGVPTGASYRESYGADAGQTASATQTYGTAQGDDVETGLRHIRQMDPRFDEKRFSDGCLDAFFRIQGAWANRDMTGVRDILTDEMHATLRGEAEQLKTQRRINRLENIAVRSVDPVEAWQEGGADFITVKIYANLLDYTVDETTSQVLSGSRTEPVKFIEYWTFTRSVGDNPWKLSAIQQTE